MLTSHWTLDVKYRYLWDKVFKNEPNKACGRQPLKKLKSRPYLFKFFKRCLPHTLFGPFLNTLSHTTFRRHPGRILNVLCMFNLWGFCKQLNKDSLRR